MEEKVDGLTQFIHFWQDVHSAEDPIQKIQEFDGLIPDDIISGLNRKVYPECYYGYLNEDTSNGVLLLLINPGGTFDDDESVARLNACIKERYLKWQKEDYLQDSKFLSDPILSLGINWRLNMHKSLERFLDQKIEFLHTIDFFPYHSKAWAGLNPKHKKLVFSLRSTRLAFEAIRQIALEKRMKFILGIGKPWVEILTKLGVPSESYPFKKREDGSVSQVITKFQFTKDSLPIVIYHKSSPGIRLPAKPEVKDKMLEMLLV